VRTAAPPTVLRIVAALVRPVKVTVTSPLAAPTLPPVEQPQSPLVDRVLLLGAVLRQRGVAVSTGALVDACTAAGHLDLADRSTFRDGLRATIVKDALDLGPFDRAFADVFRAGPLPFDESADSGNQEPTRSSPGAPPPGGLGPSLMDAAAAGDPQLLEDLAMRAVDYYAGLEDTDGSGRYHLHRVLRALDLSRIFSAVMQRLRAEGELDELGLMIRRHELSEALDTFRRLLAAEIERRRHDRHPRSTPPDDVDSIDHDVLDLSAAELADVRRVLEPLARRLAARVGRKRRRRSTGRLDVRRTMRRSLETGGVPIDPVTKRRHPHRPSLVVLCDVSGSVADFAQFTFSLVNALHDVVPNVRSFAFVDGIAEVTDVFVTSRYDVPVRRLIERNGVVRLDGHSDYGQVFSSFGERYLDETIDNRTTVIITGDARTNYRDAGLDAFCALAERARHVYWLNPEPVEEWDRRDSVIGQYRARCAGVFAVCSVRQLADVIAELV